MKFKEFIRNKVGVTTINNKLDSNLRVNNEILWSRIFNDSIQDSDWLKIKSFSPGRWALGYPALYILYRILNDIKPKSILEFGLGESTKLTYQYIKSTNNEASLKIVEQDRDWLTFFSKDVFDINENICLLPIKQVVIEDSDTYVYDNFIPSVSDVKYNLVIIDGPWGSPNNSRVEIIDLINNNLLGDDFVIIMDDYNRIGEKNTINKVQALLKNKNVHYVYGEYSGLKDTAIICSDKFKFLTSL